MHLRRVHTRAALNNCGVLDCGVISWRRPTGSLLALASSPVLHRPGYRRELVLCRILAAAKVELAIVQRAARAFHSYFAVSSAFLCAAAIGLSSEAAFACSR
jgi:hypothetical protein